MPLSEKEFALRDEFKKYRNQFGLVDDASTQWGSYSGNPLLYHAHFLWCLKKLGVYDTIDGLLFQRTVQNDFTNGPGNYRRTPRGRSFSTDQEGPDDFIGLASMSALDPRLTFARDILGHAQLGATLGSGFPARVKKPLWAKLFGWVKLNYVFNSNFPCTLLEENGQGFWLKPWLGRFPQNRAHFMFCNGEKPGLLLRLAWCLSVWQTARFWDKEGTDQWILTWYLVSSFRERGHRSFICEMASRNFMKRFLTKWPGGLASVFLPYFGASHPLTKHFPNEIFISKK